MRYLGLLVVPGMLISESTRLRNFSPCSPSSKLTHAHALLWSKLYNVCAHAQLDISWPAWCMWNNHALQSMLLRNSHQTNHSLRSSQVQGFAQNDHHPRSALMEEAVYLNVQVAIVPCNLKRD